jgi:hypothetical protein
VRGEPTDCAKSRRVWMRRGSVPHLIRKCLGFIFFDLFSNVGGTGCRRGRTPERPLRQPPQGLADTARPFCSCWWPVLARLVARGHTYPRSQIDIAKCCAPKKFPPTVGFGSFPFRYLTRGNGMPGGNNSGASDVPLGSCVSLPNSARRHLAGNVPGEAGRGNQWISRVERESPRGLKRSRRCGFHTA